LTGPRSRRDFLRLAAGAAAAAAAGTACGSGSDERKKQDAAKSKSAAADRTLHIAQWSHFVPAYDEWFDREYTKRWGERNDIEVVVDHISLPETNSRAAAEVAVQRGHDLFAFIAPPAAFEDEAIDHRGVVEEVKAKLGAMTPLAERSTYNPKTKKWFAFPDFWSPNPVNYRSDLWAQLGARPDSWDDIRAAGPKLKGMGHPLGIGLSPDFDANLGLLALMHAYGSSVQDEESRVVINRPATVEAVKVGAELFQTGMTDEVLFWDAASNNRFLATGRGSLIVNPVSGLRAVEKQDPALAANVALAPSPAGPVVRLGATSVMGAYVIWRFARNQEAAKRFLVDLALDYRDAFVHSEYYNVPAFPAGVPGLDQLVASDTKARPPEKYALLAGATSWTTNVGHPGYANGAIDEVFNQFLIPQMFAAAARKEMTAEEAVRAAETKIAPIFDKWRERGKI
jgi:multiple sugar transport system substrate-binding protein